MILSITLFIVIGVLLVFFMLGAQSKSQRIPGLVNEKLAQCSSKPNCVCSEYPSDASHYIQALPVSQNPFAILKHIILEMGGELVSEQDNYLAAIFTSSVFGFVDDVEIRFDAKKQLLHFRSASRVGHSDMGVNRKRIELLKQLYLEKS